MIDGPSIFSCRDKLSAFIEARGAASPGVLTLTSNLSKVGERVLCVLSLNRYLTSMMAALCV